MMGPLYWHLRRLVIRDAEIRYLARHGRRHARRVAAFHKSNPWAALLGWAVLGLLALALAACSTATPAAQASGCDYAGVLAYAQRGSLAEPWPCAGKVLERHADLSGLSNSMPGGATAGDRSTVPVTQGD